MAQITINIPDDKLVDVRDALCEAYGWTAETGMTKAQFSKRVVADFVKSIYVSHMASKASEIAKQNSMSVTNLVDIN